jgi:hypothetical protein
MKSSTRARFATAIAAMVLTVPVAMARDDIIRLSIADALATSDAKAMLNASLRFEFGESSSASVEKNLGKFTSSKKANSFGHEDKKACQRAFLSAMLSFQDRIAREGGDAVIHLTSYYRRQSFSSATEFECGTGALMVGVAFQGEVVKLRR